jgi:hypothetical protein
MLPLNSATRNARFGGRIEGPARALAMRARIVSLTADDRRSTENAERLGSSATWQRGGPFETLAVSRSSLAVRRPEQSTKLVATFGCRQLVRASRVQSVPVRVGRMTDFARDMALYFGLAERRSRCQGTTKTEPLAKRLASCGTFRARRFTRLRARASM